ncbi:MAG: hypothetical protein ABGY95_02430, partial [Rubritalea sp.]|uniref:hypothetical protein n=1 Tax=Rubritalea sp. TaxID=2109375 RepID=UPI003242D4DA
MLARDNPFSTHRVEQILSFDPVLSGSSWEEIDGRWVTLRERASLVAPHGAGKSTFMDAFQRRLEDSGHSVLRIFLNQETNKLGAKQWGMLENCSQKIVMLDGEEQLGFFARKRFYRLTQNSLGLLISRHNPTKLPQLLVLEPNIDLLIKCIERLAPKHLSALQPMLDQWWKEQNRNIREILLRCYDAVQRK